MTGEQRNSYAALTGLMADNLAPNAPSKKNAYSTFVALSAANIATNQPLQTTAPSYAPTPMLPPMQAVASYVNGRLALRLTSKSPYPHPIAIKAAKPILAANNVYKSAAFKKIGSIAGLSNSVDITTLYQSRFRVPGSGYKIALELVGVAPGGYHPPACLSSASSAIPLPRACLPAGSLANNA